LGPDHPDFASSLNNLAALYCDEGRYGEAEPFYQRSLAIREKAVGSDHPDVATSLNNLGLLYAEQARYAAAEPLLLRALVIREEAVGPDHPGVAASLNNLAALSVAHDDWPHAADYWRRSTDIIVRRIQRGLAGGGESLTGKRKSETQQVAYQFFGLVKMVHR